MSEVVEKLVTCPKCAQKTSTRLECSANTENNKTIRTEIFDESFFRWKCKKCGFQTKLLHPLLYNDIANEFMVYLIPKVDRQQLIDQNLEEEFAELSHIQKRIVPDVNTMKEKIVLFEQGIDDMAIELTKLASADVVAKATSKSVYSGYFMSMDEDDNTVTFQHFVGIDRRPYIQTVRLEVYQRSLSILKTIFDNERLPKGFLNINSSWAKAVKKRYDEMK